MNLSADMDTVKAEKETAMRRYCRMRTIGRLLRCLEACAAVLVLARYSPRIPDAAWISVEFLRDLASGFLGPRSVFLIGNAIVLLLFARSGKLSLSPPPSPSFPPAESPIAAEEFYDSVDEIGYFLPPENPNPPEVFEDKEVCLEERRELRRSRSAGSEGRRRRRSPELRRSESVAVKGEDEKPGSEEGDDDEEFRRTIEAFIAKQQRFQREESLAVVSSAGPPERKIVRIKII